MCSRNDLTENIDQSVSINHHLLTYYRHKIVNFGNLLLTVNNNDPGPTGEIKMSNTC